MSTAANFMRSTKAPTINAGVMTANVIWNVKKSDSGMSPTIPSNPTPRNNALPKPPMTSFAPPPSPNARP